MYGDETEEAHVHRRPRRSAVGSALYFLWRLIANTLYFALGILEPIVTTGLVACAFFLALTALVYRYGSKVTDFPFWPMMLGAVACLTSVVIYHFTMRFLRDSRRR